MQTSSNSSTGGVKKKSGRHSWTWISRVSRQTNGGAAQADQTRKKRETWELTNCFWSLWKSTTRDWFVWALALGRVKVDPDAMRGGKHNEIKAEKKREYGVRAEGWGRGGVRENIIESQESKWWKRAQRGSWLARITLRFDKIRHVWLWRLGGRGEQQRIIRGHRRARQKAGANKMLW